MNKEFAFKLRNRAHLERSMLFGIIILGALLPKDVRMITIVPMIAGALWLIVYSYLEYRKERAELPASPCRSRPSG